MNKVLIIDEIVESSQRLSTMINWEKEKYELLGIVPNGIVGRAIVEQQYPDIVLLSMSSFYLGGRGFINSVSSGDYVPQIIRLYTDENLEADHDIPSNAQLSLCRNTMTRESLLQILEKASYAIAVSRTNGVPKQSFSLQRNDAVLHILHHKYDQKTVKRLLSSFRLRMADDCLGIALMYFNQKTSQSDMESKQLINVFKYILKQNNGGEVFTETPNEIGLIINGLPSQEGYAAFYYFASVIHSIQKAAQSQFGMTLGSVWPEQVYTIENIYEGYLAVHELARYRYFSPKISLLNDDFIKKHELHLNVTRLEEPLDELADAVNKTDEQRAVLALSTIYMTLVRSSMDFLLLNEARIKLEELFRLYSSDLLALGVSVNFSNSHFADLEQEYLYVKAAFIELISQIIKNRETTNPVVQKAIMFIKQNYNSDISLNDIAREVGVSGGYLSKLFHEQTGMTFVSYLKQIRLEKAKQLLRRPSAKISDIAVSVGYADEKYFCRTFRNTTGKTPTQYRKNFLKKENEHEGDLFYR